MKLFTWLKDKWEIAVAAFAVAITALMIALRIRGQNENFENAKEAHEAEKEVNKAAEKELVEGITTIAEEKDTALEDLSDSIAKEEELLVEEKEEFAKDASESSELGKDLADLIGAEFVDAKDE